MTRSTEEIKQELEEILKLPISKKIKRLRELNGISQRELSKATGISESSIQKYELGARIPKVSSLEKIAKALNVAPGFLVNLKDDFLDGAASNKAIKIQRKNISLTEFIKSMDYTVKPFAVFKPKKRDVLLKEIEKNPDEDQRKNAVAFMENTNDDEFITMLPYYIFENENEKYYMYDDDFTELVNEVETLIRDYLKQKDIKAKKNIDQ